MMNEKRAQNIAALLIRGLSRVQKVKRDDTVDEPTDDGVGSKKSNAHFVR